MTIPVELKEALQNKPEAQKVFSSLSPSCRKEYVDWITQAKRDDTRIRRAEKAITMLLEPKGR